MPILFACPECRAQIEVGDEYAGQAGQCPRCQNVVVIPSPKQPLPILVGAEPAPAPREAAKPRPAVAEGSRARPRRSTPTPKQPAGPIWPWVVGVFAAVVIAALLFSSFAVLVFWRRTVPPPAPIADLKQGGIKQGSGVTVGRLEGQQAFMQNGVFQIRSDLNPNDPFDLAHKNSHFKRYDIQLIAGQDYVLEMETNQFDSELRIEGLNGPRWTGFGTRGVQSARIDYRPQFTAVYLIYATSPNPAFGNFTLTIREANRPKPFGP